MSIRALPQILSIAPYKGGESKLAGFEKPIKLASNENPFGASPKAVAAYHEAAAKLHLYPEGSSAVLRDAIAQLYGLDPARLICGAGSDEIFFLLSRAFLAPGDEVIVSEHAFSIYAIVAKQSDAVVKVARDANLTASVESMLALVSPRTRMVFLANPNNPTGTYLSGDELRRLQASLPENVLFVLDSAYAEFVRAADYSAGVELVSACDNVIMTRTFSKIYGLAALRVGWAYGPAGIIDSLNRTRGPFNVSTPGQLAAAAAIADTAFVDQTIEHNARELARVSEDLRAMGLAITPSVANFVLAHFPQAAGRDAPDADAFLRSKGLIVRRMEGYGLPHALRISIGKTEENDALIAALAQFCAAAP